MNNRLKGVLTLLLCACWATGGYAQFVYGTTGLLHMPTGEMQRDKTALIGASVLSPAATPDVWNYTTYNYYVNITFFPWLEIGYTCTLFRVTFPVMQIYNKFTNQDRQFSIRLRVLEEGKLHRYMPSVVVGSNDPGTSGSTVDNTLTSPDNVGNGYWNRYYLAMSKHVTWKQVGVLGVHAAYVYNRRSGYPLNGPAAGVNFRFALPEGNGVRKVLNGLNVMAEYDSRTVNVGMEYRLWKERINLIAELNDFNCLSAGIYFRIHL